MVNHKINKKIVNVIIDQMIPVSKKNKMPKASKAINIHIFYNKIKKNKEILKEIRQIILKNDFKNNTNINSFSNEIFENKKLQSFLSEPLLDDYFTSITVYKILKKKSDAISFANKKDQKEEKYLIKKIKKKL